MFHPTLLAVPDTIRVPKPSFTKPLFAPLSVPLNVVTIAGALIATLVMPPARVIGPLSVSAVVPPNLTLPRSVAAFAAVTEVPASNVAPLPRVNVPVPSAVLFPRDRPLSPATVTPPVKVLPVLSCNRPPPLTESVPDLIALVILSVGDQGATLTPLTKMGATLMLVTPVVPPLR